MALDINAADLNGDLFNARLKNITLIAEGLAPLLKLRRFIAHQGLNLRLITSLSKFFGPFNLICETTLSNQSRLDRQSAVELIILQIIIGLRLNFLNAEERLAFLYGLTFLDQDLINNAAFIMLNDLAIGINRDKAPSDNSAIQFGHSRPTTCHTKGEDDESITADRCFAPIGGC